MTGPGWQRIGPDPRIAAWSTAAAAVARAVDAASDEPWRAGGTWRAGVDALPNGPDGSLGGVAFPWAALPLRPAPLHPGQLSIVRPGYPRPGAEESEAAFRFRRDRDAAHLDGLLAEGAARHRFIREPHAWILGLPLTACDAGAAPLVVWEGSHRIMAAALRAALAPHPAETWGEIDVTAAYQAARRRVFAECPRTPLPARPGEATLLHRLTLHGVAPWADGAAAPPEGRMIAYFRPLMTSVAAWLGDA